MMIPLRHVRVHIGFVSENKFIHFTEIGGQITSHKIVSNMMDSVDNSPVGHIVVYGTIYDNDLRHFRLQPPDLHERPPSLWLMARAIASEILLLRSFDAIQAGTMLKRTRAVPSAVGGTLIMWNRRNHVDYVIKECLPVSPLDMEIGNSHWDQRSYLLYYWHQRSPDDGDHDQSKSTPAVIQSDDPMDADKSYYDWDLSPVPWEPSTSVNRPDLSFASPPDGPSPPQPPKAPPPQPSVPSSTTQTTNVPAPPAPMQAPNLPSASVPSSPPTYVQPSSSSSGPPPGPGPSPPGRGDETTIFFKRRRRLKILSILEGLFNHFLQLFVTKAIDK